MLILLLLILFNLSCASIGDKPYNNEVAGSYHQVKAGNTLSQIALMYKVSANEIADVNGLDNNFKLKIGQWLFIPNLDPIAIKIAQLKKDRPKPSLSNKPMPTNQTKPNNSTLSLDFPLPGGKIVQTFSRDKLNPYDGIGIAAKLGSPVIAAAAGKVLFVGDDGTKFGLLILIEHNDKLITVYTHLQQALVKNGQAVSRLATIGLVGQSGGIKSPRLHFQVRLKQKVVDPKLYLK